MSGEAVGISRAGESMEPKVIISFATGAFCAYEKFGNSSEGDCNTELISPEQVSNISNSDQAKVRLS